MKEKHLELLVAPFTRKQKQKTLWVHLMSCVLLEGYSKFPTEIQESWLHKGGKIKANTERKHGMDVLLWM